MTRQEVRFVIFIAGPFITSSLLKRSEVFRNVEGTSRALASILETDLRFKPKEFLNEATFVASTRPAIQVEPWWKVEDGRLRDGQGRIKKAEGRSGAVALGPIDTDNFQRERLVVP
jgi:hypothetical protein